MKTGDSLRTRLVASYVALALVLLSVIGYVFANALSLYAVSVQRTHLNAAFKQAVLLLEDARGLNLTQDETVQLLRQKLPELRVDAAQLPATKAEIFAQSGAQSGGKGVLLYTAMPGETSFMLPAGKGSPTTYYRFTAPPSAGLTLSSLYRQVLAVLVAALLLSGLAGWLLSRWIARPVVLQLRESFEKLAADRDTAQRFASDAAHELRTPVTTLRAYYEVLAEHPERLNRVSPAITRQIERMEQIIAGLLQMANLGEGGGIVLQPDDLRALLQRMESAYRAQAEASGHHLTTAWPDGPLPVLLDQRLLELAVNNLMANACKYTAPGGQLGLTLACDGSDAVITVADSGKGIPPAELAHSFDRFHRSVDSQSISGSGLGLAIAREAVQRMGGTISAESTVGTGSRFLIRLPLLPSTDGAHRQ
ncbi:MAG: Signal transduction histidine kinase [Firmicutes bacterium]|nr:Signal transduction histidine kinase [Bacillota bacterium]